MEVALAIGFGALLGWNVGNWGLARYEQKKFR